MNRHAKAASAESTKAGDKSRGLLPRAFANRDASSALEGSGAPAGRRLLAVLGLALVFCVAIVAPASADSATASVDSVSDLGADTAHLSGTVTLEGPPPSRAIAKFEYTSDPSNTEPPVEPFVIGWNETPFFGLSPDSTDPIQVETDMEHLAPETKYWVRLLVVLDDFSYFADPVPHFSFTTPAATAPVVALDPATITGTNAHLSGTVTAGNANANCDFEYVADGAFQPLDEQQSLAVKAEGGDFKLLYEGEETAPIAFDAGASTVQSALENLTAIAAGNVTVAGGPGDASGATPYTLTFSGDLAATNVGQVFADSSALTGAEVNAETTITTEGASGFESAQTTPCTPAVAKRGGSPTPVQADLSDLQGNTTYHLRLKASNLGGDTFDANTFHTEAEPPIVLETFVSDVALNSATLNAEINPVGDATTYHFEYLTLDEFEAATPGDEFAGAIRTDESTSIGDDNQAHSVSTAVPDLQPDTAYRYRVVAKNSKSGAGGTPGPVRAFHTAAKPVAQVCPNAAVRDQQGSAFLPECRAYELINTPGLDLGDVYRIVYSSADGDSVAYLSTSAPNGAFGSGVVSISLARRGADRWNSTSADPVSTGATNITGYTEFKAFSADLSRALVLTALPLDAGDLDGQSDIYRVDVGHGTSTLMSQEEDIGSVALVGGASSDLDRVVFQGNPGSGSGLFVGDGVGPEERLSVYPDGTPIPSATALASPMFTRGDNIGGEGGLNSSQFVERGGAHGVSDDARRIYFTDNYHLFVRDLVAQPPRTVAVGVSSRADDVGAQHSVNFISATHDGSSAYVWTNDQLTDAATPGGGIYRFDLGTGAMTQVTPAAEPGGINVEGAIVSDDQSHIYFTSTAALAGPAQTGDMNAYVWTAAGGFRFIAEVNSKRAFVRVTPDGRYALLLTDASIGGAPNGGHQAVYLYDYGADQVTCASCRPDGSTSTAASSIDAQSAGEPGASLTLNRALSFNGRVAFTSGDHVVARDHNSAEDVYLYHDGTVSLLTPGGGGTGSYVADISDDGVNVSIMTRSALLGADRDAEEYDAYNVRVGGGFLESPPPPAPCEGEACRGPGSVDPAAIAPTTSGFVGPGNSKKCVKGKIRRNGRCVKARKHRRHQKKQKAQKHTRMANDDRRAGR